MISSVFGVKKNQISIQRNKKNRDKTAFGLSIDKEVDILVKTAFEVAPKVKALGAYGERMDAEIRRLEQTNKPLWKSIKELFNDKVLLDRYTYQTHKDEMNIKTLTDDTVQQAVWSRIVRAITKLSALISGEKQLVTHMPDYVVPPQGKFQILLTNTIRPFIDSHLEDLGLEMNENSLLTITLNKNHSRVPYVNTGEGQRFVAELSDRYVLGKGLPVQKFDNKNNIFVGEVNTQKAKRTMLISLFDVFSNGIKFVNPRELVRKDFPKITNLNHIATIDPKKVTPFATVDNLVVPHYTELFDNSPLYEDVLNQYTFI